eukprot:9498323-Pyramimonas_sp.AAC.3
MFSTLVDQGWQLTKDSLDETQWESVLNSVFDMEPWITGLGTEHAKIFLSSQYRPDGAGERDPALASSEVDHSAAARLAARACSVVFI